MITPELLRRYDRPGPRYTSYPTAVEFQEDVDNAAYARHLKAAAARVEEPLSLYLHLPFCEERCLYCGCNVVITRRRELAERYLEALIQEIREVARRLGPRRKLRQFHWGGGTPTFYHASEIRRLHQAVVDEFEIEEGAEGSVEVDPRVTTEEHLTALRECGFNRISLGVQDFTPEVQELVHRVQSVPETEELVALARRLGFESTNIDLIYGLPLQTPETFRQTLDEVVRIRPERIAVYSYAHVPWLKVQQRQIPPETLPSPEVKLELIASALECFPAAGYRAIGMDHFALPEDALGQALEAGTLWRNFMGYTVRHAPDTVACGMSAIGDVAGAFVQNEHKVGRYLTAIESGGLAVHRGYVLTEDDLLRRHIITSLMCTLGLDIPDLEERFGIDFHRHFAPELEELEAFEEDGFLRKSPHRIQLVDLGRLFVRNVCMVFDAHLKKPASTEQRFSRTV